MAQPPSPWPKRKRQPDPAFEEKREAVLRAAAHLFVAQGYENTSLNELARALNVTKPTLYYYFESKEQILLEIVERSSQQHAEALDHAIRTAPNGREKLRLICDLYARLMTQDFGKVQIKINWRALPDAPREDLRGKLVRTDRIVRDVIAEGVADGSLAECDVKFATFMIFGALNWIAYWHHEDGDLDAANLASRMVDLLFRGLDTR